MRKISHDISSRALLLAAAATIACTSFTTGAIAAPGVEGLSLSMIPQAAGPLSVLRFKATSTGQSFVREALARTVPAATAGAANAEGATRFLAADRTVAYISADTANSEIFADLEHLPAGKLAASAALNLARGVFARQDVIPKDDTTVALASPSVLYGGLASPTAATQSHAAGPKPLLTYVAARREVDGMPVLGRGSRASVGVANDGTISAFVKHWRAAERVGTVSPTLSASGVEAAIVAQLRHFENATTHVVVDRVGLGYYDGDASYLQPVYYFTARLLPRGQAARAVKDGDAVVGYVPFGAPVEAVPDLSHPTQATQMSPFGGPVSLGEYVVRNDDANWVADANEFYSGLGAGATRNQYYWAMPYEYTSSANSYVNSVNVVDTEAHGDWGLYTTYQNWGDVVNINQIGTAGNPAYGGYGNANKLAHWWIHSCEVIPSMFDLQITTGNYWNAFTPWWNVFSGLHQAVGYRTIMFIDDDAAYPYAQSMANGGAWTQSWFNTVSTLTDYVQGWTYLSYHLNRQVPYGEPSVISIPGLQNDTLSSNIPAHPAYQTGLYNFYLVGATD